jgi:hypothetical protein
MSQTLNSKIAVIGIDIGKNSFHIVAQVRRGALVRRQKWSRGPNFARDINAATHVFVFNAVDAAARIILKIARLRMHSWATPGRLRQWDLSAACGAAPRVPCRRRWSCHWLPVLSVRTSFRLQPRSPTSFSARTAIRSSRVARIIATGGRLSTIRCSTGSFRLPMTRISPC